MNNWIKAPLTLSGETVSLLSLEHQHVKELVALGSDKRIWEFYVFDGSDSIKLNTAMELAFSEREKGAQFPFAIFHNKEKRIIGSTRFLDLQPAHKKLEIGWTWLHPDHWATTVNLECKLLLLTYCFETLQTARVQLKTDENNIRSRKAIEKIGGQYEGILRNDMVRENGTNRNSAYYSVIDSEWPELKIKLTQLHQHNRT